jgi:hypothetical protein
VKAVVVYESHWGNTAAVARAIASGLGDATRVLATDEATDSVLADADLIVAGAPVMAFRLPTDSMRERIAENPQAPKKADLAHPSMREWLDHIPAAKGQSAAFETRLPWSPGGATGAIERGLQTAGYRRVSKGRKFFVTGIYGPLRDGEIERARVWGSQLARALRATTRVAGTP